MQVLIDESDGRAKARVMGLKPVGVLGILLRAKKAGQIDSVRQVMQEARNSCTHVPKFVDGSAHHEGSKLHEFYIGRCFGFN